jgi:phosphohistidine phosphatase SixA
VIKLRYLIIARHGSYDSEGLTPKGNEEIHQLAKALQRYTDDARVKMLSSTAPRAIESTEILACILEVAFSNHEALWSDHDHRVDLPTALKLIESEGSGDCDVLVLVSHFEYAELLPAYFGKEVLGVVFPKKTINKGKALIIDCEAGTCTLAPDHFVG